jgi:hypothetical protein
MRIEDVLRQALEALEYIDDGANNQGAHTGISWRCVSNKAQPAITSLRQAIAEAEKQEPVAWRHDMGEENGGWEYFEEASCDDCQPLYTHTQTKERNFCERCGKRLGKNDTDIHTCTPPKENE